MSSGICSAILDGASRDLIESEARKALWCDLRTDGLLKVRQGATTLEEVARVVGLQQLSGAAAGDSE